MSHVFISYATDDRALAEEVCALLEARGIACWIAPRDVAPGAQWDEAIVDAITEAGAFLLILTATSNESPFVKNEVNHAFSAKKTIFTFRAEDVVPSKSLGFYLARHHWTDGFSARLEETTAQLATAVTSVLAATGGIVASAAAGVATLPHAAKKARVVSRATRRERIAWTTAGAALAVGAALGVGAARFVGVRPEPAPSIRFSISAPPGAQLPTVSVGSLAVSPDGTRIAFQIVAPDGSRLRLAVRALDADEAREVPGTDGGTFPFWSPDSRSIAFAANGKLKTISLNGGASQVLCDLPTGQTLSGSGSWSADGTMVFAGQNTALFRVPSGGGTPVPLTTLDAAKKELGHSHPWFLPDGQHFLYVARAPEGNAVYIGSLADSERTLLVPSEAKAIYADGHLLFLRQGTLLAQPFDVARRATTGDAVVLAQGVYNNPVSGAAALSSSATGVLAYRMDVAAAPTQLALVDRRGTLLRTFGEPLDQTGVELSPDGTRVAVSVFDPSRRSRDIWIHDLTRDIRRRFTFSAGEAWMSTWSPDGTRLLFSAGLRAEGAATALDLYQQAADGSGTAERLVASPVTKYVTSWSSDGGVVLYHTGTGGSQTGSDLWVLPLSGDRNPRPLLQTPFNEVDGRFSPDGRWVAYVSNESGRAEVYVMPSAGPGGKWQISSGGGTQPRWRRDGREIFYRADGTSIMAAAVNGQGAAFEVGTVQRLFEARLRTAAYAGYGTGYVYDAAADGQRFLLNQIANVETPQPPIRVVTNWTAALTKP